MHSSSSRVAQWDFGAGHGRVIRWDERARSNPDNQSATDNRSLSFAQTNDSNEKRQMANAPKRNGIRGMKEEIEITIGKQRTIGGYHNGIKHKHEEINKWVNRSAGLSPNVRAEDFSKPKEGREQTQ